MRFFSVDPNDSVIGGCLAGASSNPVSHRCFIEQESLPLLLSTGWFQELVQA